MASWPGSWAAGLRLVSLAERRSRDAGGLRAPPEARAGVPLARLRCSLRAWAFIPETEATQGEQPQPMEARPHALPTPTQEPPLLTARAACQPVWGTLPSRSSWPGHLQHPPPPQPGSQLSCRWHCPSPAPSPWGASPRQHELRVTCQPAPPGLRPPVPLQAACAGLAGRVLWPRRRALTPTLQGGSGEPAGLLGH